MAPVALVLDASVVVKWFSTADESHLTIALTIRDAHINSRYTIMVPDILYHEVANALVHKTKLETDYLIRAVNSLFDLNMVVFPVNSERLRSSVQLARAAGITEYDAFYAIVAIENHCPLVTANPKHQRKIPGCKVIPLEKWPREEG